MHEMQLAMEVFKLALGQAIAEIENNPYDPGHITHHGVHTINAYYDHKLNEQSKIIENNGVQIIINDLSNLCALAYELEGQYQRAEHLYEKAGAVNKQEAMSKKEATGKQIKEVNFRTSRVWEKALNNFKQTLKNNPVHMPIMEEIKNKINSMIEVT